MSHLRYYQRSSSHYTPALKKIAELFLLPFLSQKPTEVRDEDFLDYIFNVEASVIKTYICTSEGGAKLLQPKSATTDYETLQPVKFYIGDLVTARKIEGALKMDIEIQRTKDGKVELYRIFPTKWSSVRKFIESKEELNLRAGS